MARSIAGSSTSTMRETCAFTIGKVSLPGAFTAIPSASVCSEQTTSWPVSAACIEGQAAEQTPITARPGLIACAVRTAADHGCQQFFATVLAQNVRYFQRQHFGVLSPLQMCGRSHVLMQADVAAHTSRAKPGAPQRPAL